MTANELQGLLATLDDALANLDVNANACCMLGADCRMSRITLRVAQALKPQRDVVREAYLRAVRVEAMMEAE